MVATPRLQGKSLHSAQRRLLLPTSSEATTSFRKATTAAANPLESV
jgi:hypothetical protein